MSWIHHRRSNLSVQAILNIMEEEGFRPARCLEGVGLKASQVLDAETTISDETEIKILHQALTILPKKAGYGIRVGRALRATTFGVPGLVFLTSPSLRAAAAAMKRLSQLSMTLSKVRLSETENKAYYTLHMKELPESIHLFLLERYYASMAMMLMDMIPMLSPRDFEINIPAEKAEFADELSKITQSRVIAEGDTYALITDRLFLDYPLPNADPLAHAHFIEQCEAMLGQHETLQIHAQKVRDYIIKKNEFSPKLEDVARSNGMSARSLRRRLQEEDTTFSQVVLGTKMALAREFLSTAKMPVSAVADKLGYSESASFTRAFSSWWGALPSKVSNDTDAHQQAARTAK